jgi:hypothetical protein
VQRGFMFQSWYQFMKADMVICGASSFCLWPALANKLGTVYLPLSPVIANNTAVNFGVSNVHFIENYGLHDISRGGAVGAVVNQLTFAKPFPKNRQDSELAAKLQKIRAIKKNREKVTKLANNKSE